MPNHGIYFNRLKNIPGLAHFGIQSYEVEFFFVAASDWIT